MSISNYRLNVHFNEDDLKEVEPVRDVESPVGWGSFKPWHQNKVDWENTFAIYASNSEIQKR